MKAFVAVLREESGALCLKGGILFKHVQLDTIRYDIERDDRNAKFMN
jgi:hypothetical protein